MISEKFAKFLEQNGYCELKELPDGRIAGLHRFAFTVGLCVGLSYDGYSGRYCYENLTEAIGALKEWNGEADPSGPWIKYKGYGGERSNESSKF